MKKYVVVALCLLMASTAFGLERAIGGGLFFGETWTKGRDKNQAIDWDMSRTSLGFFGFFGLGKYVEFNAGYLYKIVSGGMMGPANVEIASTSAVQLGAYGKYPFVLSDRWVLFPTAGADFEISFNTGEVKWWHDLWLRGGLGADFFLNEKLFVRGHLLYGVAIPMGASAPLKVKSGHGYLVKLGLGYML